MPDPGHIMTSASMILIEAGSDPEVATSIGQPAHINERGVIRRAAHSDTPIGIVVRTGGLGDTVDVITSGQASLLAREWYLVTGCPDGLVSGMVYGSRASGRLSPGPFPQVGIATSSVSMHVSPKNGRANQLIADDDAADAIARELDDLGCWIVGSVWNTKNVSRRTLETWTILVCGIDPGARLVARDALEVGTPESIAAAERILHEAERNWAIARWREDDQDLVILPHRTEQSARARFMGQSSHELVSCVPIRKRLAP